jgi:hypothetical protein
MKYTLRPDQQRALDEARAHVEAGRRSVLIVGPTGFGKSVLIADIARRHVELGGRVLAVVHRIELVQQLAGKLRDAGLQVSEIHPGATAFPASAQVASIQTLLAREVSFEPTLMIWDEAHHVLAETWNKLLPPSGLIVGLTATPMLADGTGLGSVFSSMVVAASRQELRDSGVLVPCEVISPDRALGPRELAQDPVDAYQTHTPGEQAILFAPSVETAIQYACAFRDASVPAAAVWGDMPTKDRERVMAEFRAGSLRVLTSVAILTEGFDHPPTSVCILARGVGHLGLYDQWSGACSARPLARRVRCCWISPGRRITTARRMRSVATASTGVVCVALRICPTFGSVQCAAPPSPARSARRAVTRARCDTDRRASSAFRSSASRAFAKTTTTLALDGSAAGSRRRALAGGRRGKPSTDSRLRTGTSRRALSWLELGTWGEEHHGEVPSGRWQQRPFSGP